MQKNLLAANPQAELRVYAVWFNMYPGDDRSRWPPRLLDDPRVLHFWDEGKQMGKFYRKHLGLGESYRPEALWDAYILYDGAATWEAAPSPHVGWGRTLIGAHAQLREEIQPLLQPAVEAK